MEREVHEIPFVASLNLVLSKKSYKWNTINNQMNPRKSILVIPTHLYWKDLYRLNPFHKKYMNINVQNWRIPASPGKHAVPPVRTTVLNQESSPVNSAAWQWSIQSATAWCTPIARLYGDEQKTMDTPLEETNISRIYVLFLKHLERSFRGNRRQTSTRSP